MAKKCMLIDASQPEETRVAVLQDSQLIDFDCEESTKKPLKGNIYLGKIIRIEPSLQAAFIEYGRNKHGFLAFTEIHPDYFRIPVADREKTAGLEDSEKLMINEGQPPEDHQGDDFQDTAESYEGSTEDIGLSNLTQNDEEAEAHKESLEAEEEARKKFSLYRNYKIQEVIQSRQVVLIQVVKEERGNKGAALTTFVSLAGRYSVLMPNALNAGGISRKITDLQHRKRLKTLMKDLGVPEGMSLIIRTAGLDRTKAEIKRDYTYLINLWSDIREQTLKANAPALISEEASLTRRALRDMYTPDIDEAWIQGEEAFKEAREFIKVIMPNQAKRIKLYKDSEEISLFQRHKVEQQIENIYAPQVKLPSGGYLVINATEALVAIDVNSGQATRERHIDSTALKTNLEAAEEISRQLRLRDLAGLLVIDFIDMSDIKHNIAVEKKLKECLASDRARIQVGRISQFGLLEMSRQRLRPSAMEAVSIKCPYCVGAGFVRSKESLSLQLLRVLEELAPDKEASSTEEKLKVKMSSELAFYLLSEKRQQLFELEMRRGNFFSIIQDDELGSIGFRIEGTQGNFVLDSANTKSSNKSTKDGNKSKKNNRRNRHKTPIDESSLSVSDEIVETKTVEEHQLDESSTEAQESSSGSQNESSGQKKRRNRKRRWQNKGKNAQPTQEASPSSSPSTEYDEFSEPGDVNGNSIHKPSVSRPSNDSGQPKKKSSKGGWWKKILENND